MTAGTRSPRTSPASFLVGVFLAAAWMIATIGPVAAANPHPTPVPTAAPSADPTANPGQAKKQTPTPTAAPTPAPWSATPAPTSTAAAAFTPAPTAQPAQIAPGQQVDAAATPSSTGPTGGGSAPRASSQAKPAPTANVTANTQGSAGGGYMSGSRTISGANAGATSPGASDAQDSGVTGSDTAGAAGSSEGNRKGLGQMNALGIVLLVIGIAAITLLVARTRLGRHAAPAIPSGSPASVALAVERSVHGSAVGDPLLRAIENERKRGRPGAAAEPALAEAGSPLWVRRLDKRIVAMPTRPSTSSPGESAPVPNSPSTENTDVAPSASGAKEGDPADRQHGHQSKDGDRQKVLAGAPGRRLTRP